MKVIILYSNVSVEMRGWCNLDGKKSFCLFFKFRHIKKLNVLKEERTIKWIMIIII